MKMPQCEQVDNRLPHFPRGKYEKMMKKRQSRLERRFARRHPEEAPRKHYFRGYTT